MLQTNHVLELVVFKVKPSHTQQLAQLRADLRKTLTAFPGWLDYTAYGPIADGLHADLVKWQNLEAAKAAAQAFANGDPRFAAYGSAIESVSFMGHFAPT
jgi:quinol monooxygenase YgiN